MANWQRRLELQPEWSKFQNEDITRNEMCKVIADRLEKLSPFPATHYDHLNFGRDDLVDEFRALSTEPEITCSDFNRLMNELYDWADTSMDGNIFGGKKVCWVNTTQMTV